ncbi:MAG TPA: lipopolysaccharide transport periplasmic protein LptA [Pseudohaliea sp.]|nr:lipopolysaccharide transport periplasmic protein LptA [Pseudohaliea sp.]
MNGPALLLLALVSLWAAGAGALPGDRDQPIAVEADSAVRDEKAGQTIYRGDVRLVQGSLVIEADELTIFHSRDLAERVVALGAPARMQQRPEIDDAVIHAEARRITYFTADERVLLEEQALVEQDGATVRGERIDYLIREQLVRADAADSGGERVQVVIPPRLAEEAGQEDDGSAAPATTPAGAPPAAEEQEAEPDGGTEGE